MQPNGIYDSSQIDNLTARVKAKDAKILELEKEAALLRDEKTMMEVEVRNQIVDKSALLTGIG